MVDATNGLTGMLPKVSTTQILNWLMIGMIIIILLSVFAYFFWYYTKRKKYSEFRIEIFDKDTTGNIYKIYDRGGVFLDKRTGFKLLFLEKCKVGLNPNKIPYISSKDKKGRLIKTVYLRKIGVNNYVYIDMKLGDSTKFTVGEEDLNNAAQEMAKIRRTYNKESWLTKLAPIIVMVLCLVVFMVCFVSLLNKFTIVETVSKNLDDTAAKQLEVTQLLYNLTDDMKVSPVFNKDMPIIVGGAK